MKKIFLILFLLYTSIFADAIEWMEYDKALSISKAENKTIMVMLSSTNCGVCKYMKDVVFKDKNIINEFNQKFLAVYIELDFDDIPNDLEYMGTPTFYFLDKNEKKLHRLNGGRRAPGFLKMLNEIN